MDKSLIIINGPMGSGKTTIGRLLHSRLERTAILSTDAIKFFLSDFERSDRDNSISAAVLMQMCKEYIKQGINVLLPQGFWKKEYIEPYIRFAEENDTRLFVYQLEAPRWVLMERVKNRPKSELAKTPVPEERVVKNLDTWEENRYWLGKVFDTSKLSSEEIVTEIIKDIKGFVV